MAAVTIYEWLIAEWKSQAKILASNNPGRQILEVCAAQLEAAAKRDRRGAEMWRDRFHRSVAGELQRNPRQLVDAELQTYYRDLQAMRDVLSKRLPTVEALIIAAENELAARSLLQ